MTEDITRYEAVCILLDIYKDLAQADLSGNEKKCVALMMAITTLADISTKKLYEIIPNYWKPIEEVEK